VRLISHLVCRLAVVSLLVVASDTQEPAAVTISSGGPPDSQSVTQQEIPTFKASTRLVSVEVVARDHKGQAVPGLTAGDFQVFEQIAPKREQHPQKISAFRATSVHEIAAQDAGKPQMAPGVYTNLITMNKVPVPPTILLVDGLNTDRVSQMQVHQQMLRMLASIPDNVPIAVFLLGRRLRMVQNFTTDPKLLKSALDSARSAEHDDSTEVDPRDDPDAMSAILEDNPTSRGAGPMLDAVRRFEQETYSFQLDIRVQETLDALEGIARYVAGYPGRKNLLWISSSFPILFLPDPDTQLPMRAYGKDIAGVASALADAKVAVYPVDPGGLQVSSVFTAGSRVRRNVTGTLSRDATSRFDRQESMQALADQTGGKICVSDNDLGDCVKKATDDSSFFYEIAYYPNSGDWHGEFHRIIVKSTRPGIHLTYRQGYYARGLDEETNPKSAAEELQRAACLDVLTSTSVLMVAKAFPEPGKLKYFVAIEPSTITFMPQSDGTQHVLLKVALCSFDKTGKPLRYLQDTIDETLTEKEYAEAKAQHGFARVVSLLPTPGVAVVRVLIKDVATGRMGSVNIPNVETAAAATSPAATAPGTPLPH
jgi:VWFA-related protein